MSGGWADARASARLALAALATGLTVGLGAMALALLLHRIQHLAFGYDLGGNAAAESFLDGVTGAPPLRRLASLLLCGVVAGAGWRIVRGSPRRLVSVKEAVGSDRGGVEMPAIETIAHALLQIVTVALGSPLGREVAPREIGALIAQRISRLAKLGPADGRLIVACGAGAGLAAVYNVPLGGALFVLEVLLESVTGKAAITALATCAVAAVTAWIGLGDGVQYVAGPIGISWSLVVWSLLAGPVLGAAAVMFTTATVRCRAAALRSPKLIVTSIAVFGLIGLAAALFPQLPGNGRGPIQLALDGRLGLLLIAELLLLKLTAIMGSLRAGAAGGLLTPGMTVGGLAALLLGAGWNVVAPAQTSEAYMVVGMAAFLASSMSMPLTAIVLVMEFTRMSHDALIPVALAVVGSVGAKRLIEAR